MYVRWGGVEGPPQVVPPPSLSVRALQTFGAHRGKLFSNASRLLLQELHRGEGDQRKVRGGGGDTSRNSAANRVWNGEEAEWSSSRAAHVNQEVTGNAIFFLFAKGEESRTVTGKSLKEA